MLTIHSYHVPNGEWINAVLAGMRNSWESWEKGDSRLLYGDDTSIEIGPLDKALCLKLINAGKDHGKFLRQIPILLDFTSPEYFLKEFDTYKIATVCNRTSMMHTLGKRPFDRSMFSFDSEEFEDKTVDTILETLNYLRAKWIDEGGKKKGPNAEYWRAMVQAVPQAFNYRSTWQGNYQTLRDMLQSRKSHRLREWREFCSFVETLPYSELITAE